MTEFKFLGEITLSGEHENFWKLCHLFVSLQRLFFVGTRGILTALHFMRKEKD